MLTLNQLKSDLEIQTLLNLADHQLDVMGYTEHGARHRSIVCARTQAILQSAGATAREVELGKISAYLHDVGCFVARQSHAQSGALLSYRLLRERGMDVSDCAIVANAIANHDEQTGHPCSKVSAALVIADKSDVHRDRVRKGKLNGDLALINASDIHDRVNYSVISSEVVVDEQTKRLLLCLGLDANVSSAMDYFEIFLGRMKMCKQAAKVLGFTFNLKINGQILA